MFFCKHVYCLLFSSVICPLSLNYPFNCPRMSGTIYIAAILLYRFHIKTILLLFTLLHLCAVSKCKERKPINQNVSEQQ